MNDESIKSVVSNSETERAKKFIIRAEDGGIFETASFWRPKINRYDLCVSSMSGCLMGCKICGCTYNVMGNERALLAHELTKQIDLLMDDGKDFIVVSKKPSPHYIGFSGDGENQYNTMVVITFMGNGDPLNNIESVISAVDISHSKYADNITRFGISTIVPKNTNLANSIKSLLDYCLKEGVEMWMQYSVVSMNEKIRKNLLPNAISLSEAVVYMDKYAHKIGIPTRYNFPMIKGINDSKEHLDEIVKFILEKPLLRMVKLSTYNEIVENKLKACSIEEMKKASEYLKSRGLNRVDLFLANNDKHLSAACGQMRKNIIPKI